MLAASAIFALWLINCSLETNKQTVENCVRFDSSYYLDDEQMLHQVNTDIICINTVNKPDEHMVNKPEVSVLGRALFPLMSQLILKSLKSNLIGCNSTCYQIKGPCYVTKSVAFWGKKQEYHETVKLVLERQARQTKQWCRRIQQQEMQTVSKRLEPGF